MDCRLKQQILSQVIAISSSSALIQDRLLQAAHFLCVKGVAPVIAVYLCEDRDHFLKLRLAADSGGRLQLPAPPWRYRLPAPDNSLCRPLTTMLPNALEDVSPDDSFLSRYPEGWVLPLADDQQAYGVMVLASSETFDMVAEKIIFLQIICRLLALALRAAVLKEHDRVKVLRHKFLHQIGARLNRSRDPKVIFPQLASAGLPLFAEAAAFLRIFQNGNGSEMVLEHGFGNRARLDAATGASRRQADQARFSNRPLIIDSPEQFPEDPVYEKFFQFFSAHLILPLRGGNQNLGVIEFFLSPAAARQNLLPPAAEDLELLEILADHLAATVERSRTQSKLTQANQAAQLRTRQLTLSHHIKNALLAADTPETIIRLTLGALISEYGFLCGTAAYFAYAEANHTWLGRFFAAINESGHRPEDGPLVLESSIDKLTRKLLQSSAELPATTTQLITTTILPQAQHFPGRLQQIVNNQRPRLLEANFITVLHNNLPDLFPGCSKFLIIPLCRQNQPHGLILARGDRISLQDLEYITLFTDAAGLALDNSLLFQRLQNSLASLNSAQHRLAQSEKLMALGEMATSIAHEIKNPLVSIAGFARRLHKKIPEDSREKTYSNIITKEIERLEEIVNNVLSFSQAREENFVPVNLNLLLEETFSLFDRQLKREKIVPQLDLCPQLKEVECDGNQIKQVIINLINNSLQAMSNLPEMRPRHLLLRTSFCCDLKNREDESLIELEDNGEGIQEQFIHDIFNPFFTTKHDGTGLGLPICHRIVMNHQGEIRINNRVGKGVKVSISLPFFQKKSTGPSL